MMNLSYLDMGNEKCRGYSILQLQVSLSTPAAYTMVSHGELKR